VLLRSTNHDKHLITPLIICRLHNIIRNHGKVINRTSFTMSTKKLHDALQGSLSPTSRRPILNPRYMIPKKKLNDALQGSLSPTSRRPILNPRYMLSRRGSVGPSRPAPAARRTRRTKSCEKSMQEMLSAYDALVKEMDDEEGDK
jgi:hypothetical protein